MALNTRQDRFAREYALSGNASEAARAAGYSEHTAKQQGSRLLSNADVKKLINEIRDAAALELGIDLNHLIAEMYKLKDEAKAAGKYSTAARALATLMRRLEPIEVHHSGAIEIKINGADVESLK